MLSFELHIYYRHWYVVGILNLMMLPLSYMRSIAYPWLGPKYTIIFILTLRSSTFRPNDDMRPIFNLRTDARPNCSKLDNTYLIEFTLPFIVTTTISLNLCVCNIIIFLWREFHLKWTCSMLNIIMLIGVNLNVINEQYNLKY